MTNVVNGFGAVYPSTNAALAGKLTFSVWHLHAVASRIPLADPTVVFIAKLGKTLSKNKAALTSTLLCTWRQRSTAFGRVKLKLLYSNNDVKKLLFSRSTSFSVTVSSITQRMLRTFWPFFHWCHPEKEIVPLVILEKPYSGNTTPGNSPHIR